MVRRAWEWWRGQRILVDFAFMLPLLGISLLMIPQITGPSPLGEPAPGMPTPPNEWACLALTLMLCLPLALRRRWPRGVFAFVALVSFVQWLVGIQALPANLAVLVAMYTMAAELSLRWAVAAWAVVELGALLEVLREVDSRDWDAHRDMFLSWSFFVAAWWILGVYIRTRRAYYSSVEERAERAERERDTQVQIAMAAERARIARELHDVVAHNVSVMVVQADGASFAIETDVERARRALETIGDTGRHALAEMRRLLGVLREDDDAGSYAPQPGVEQLADLVEQIRSAGLPLEFEVAGVPLELSEGRQLTVFRVVQEALTNTLKHGGPRASAQVRLHYGDDALEVRVTDDGRGAAAPGDGAGHGLVGMRERVAVYGGSVRAGPRPGGGYEVVALIPVREETRV
ncbi:sensor histidine kinase [Actinomadura craniellae]|uniref:histidine kinase n=1 Tax=Actinomadura craniellae TaxID=2231787 RepID=A0A365HAQ9_9ACTN|nr:histidine kinase [Actinomadura craniellae]RAY15353.1 sensor histidine kinase [Actinomadura craniellae]